MDTIKWPEGAQCAVLLTFDFDAETLWISRNAENINRPGILSQGLYGARVGVPKILETPKGPDLKEDVENLSVLKSLLFTSA